MPYRGFGSVANAITIRKANATTQKPEPCLSRWTADGMEASTLDIASPYGWTTAAVTRPSCRHRPGEPLATGSLNGRAISARFFLLAAAMTHLYIAEGRS